MRSGTEHEMVAQGSCLVPVKSFLINIVNVKCKFLIFKDLYDRPKC